MLAILSVPAWITTPPYVEEAVFESVIVPPDGASMASSELLPEIVPEKLLSALLEKFTLPTITARGSPATRHRR